ncbi:MAG: sodium:proton antiporter [Ignavibacteria bacterium]|nr:sodium:proton antiporter [Ignavibacteria bacterium]
MSLFHLLSALIVLSAGFTYINFRFLKLPNAIGLMIVSLLFSLLILAAGQFFPIFESIIELKVSRINFTELLLEGMLSFMLFAGAIHVNYEDLKSEKLSIILFSTASVIISTLVIGFSAYYLLSLSGIEINILHAFLFGALISPTDPVAVLSILKSAGISKSLETKIAGESLFNDGVAVVVFLTILKLGTPGADVDAVSVLALLIREAGGGILLGILLGYAGNKLMDQVKDYKIQVLITVAVVMGGYTIADLLNLSGPLAMVVAGIMTGNSLKKSKIQDVTSDYINKFWELIDEILNALLFVLIGLELLVIKTNKTILLISFILVFIALIARYISVWIPSLIIRFREKITQKTLLILTWGGLRGGISIALALSIQPEADRDIWVTGTYVVVCFSILVQGLTVGKLSKKIV